MPAGHQQQKMLLVTVILAFILVANGLDCVWLKNAQGAGKLTSLMESSSGPAQFNFKSENRLAKYIDIHLQDSLNASSNIMRMIINIGIQRVQQSSWVSFDNLNLNVLFNSPKTAETANQTKHLSYGLKANISFHLKMFLLVYTTEGSFIFNFGLSADHTTQNQTQVLNLKPSKQKQGKFGSYLHKGQQTKLLYLLISVLIMANDIYFLKFYSKLQTSFRLSRTASALYLFSQIIYFIEIFEVPQSRFQSQFIMFVLVIAAGGKVLNFALKMIDGFNNSSLREIIEGAIVMVIGLTLSYSLYFFALVYCIFRDTQANAQMKYTQDQRWLSHCKTLSVILYLPAFKLIYNIPTGFPFDSALFWWSYLFMLVYLSSICEISYRGGVKACIHNAKQILSTKVRDYCSILKNRKVKNGKVSKMAEEDSQFDEIDHKKDKKKQMKYKSK